jgi:hypothetical protein
MTKSEEIDNATSSKPYLLFDNFYTYENKVFEINSNKELQYEIPNADPLTFRKEGKVFADKNYVFTKRPRNRSDFNFPDKNIIIRILNIFWEYIILDNIDGKSFIYFNENKQVKYYKDLNNVYIESGHLGYPSLKKVEIADVNTFECMDFSYAKDRNHVFFKDKVININPEKCKVNINRFIWDTENIYHYDTKIPLDAKTFEVLSYESKVNPYLGKIILRDKNGQYEFSRSWQSKNIILKKNNCEILTD